MYVCAIGTQPNLVGTAVATNYWRNAMFQTLRGKNWTGFLTKFSVYSVIGLFLPLATVYQRYFMQWLLARVLHAEPGLVLLDEANLWPPRGG